MKRAEELWAERIDNYLRALHKTQRDALTGARGAAGKVAVPAVMKSASTASNPWLAQRLHMGSPFRPGRRVTECCDKPSAFQPHAKMIAKCKV